MDCLFCQIAAGNIPSDVLYQDEQILVFRDIDPQAPEHFLVIPKTHIPGADAVTAENAAVIGHIFQVIAELARQLGLDAGYRVVTNCGKDGGQTVPHLHFHVLAGRMLAWPPG